VKPPEVTLHSPLGGCDMTLTVRVSALWRARLWLGLLLLKVAVLVLGGTPNVNVEDHPEGLS
jgi:hypothetical protein